MGPFNFDYPGSWWRPDAREVMASEARVRAWESRQLAVSEGAETLTLAELGALIKQTEATLSAAPGSTRARVRRRLDAMKLEFLWREFLHEDQTTWPK